MLIIAGDKIYPAATELGEIIQSAPSLQFKLSFIELRCFRLNIDSDWPLIIFPSVIAKSREVDRAVVKVIYEEKKPDIRV